MELETLIKTVAKESKLLYSKLVNLSHARKIAIFLVISVFAIAIGLGASGVRFAYKVNYGGEVIATVKNKAQFDTAVKMVKEKVNSFESDIEEAVETPKYEATVVLNSGIDSEDAIADAIIANTEKIVEGYELRIDGKVVARLENDNISAYLNEHKNSFSFNTPNSVCEYEKNIELEKAYFLTSDFNAEAEAILAVDAVPVKCVATVVTDIEIANKTIKESTNTMLRGDTKVLVAGSNGIRRITETITTVNGVVSEKVTLGDVVVKEPVNRVVKVGTAISTASASQQLIAQNSGFICPLPAGSFKISAYYGDGRNHKGIDLCAPRGTSIFAVASGTVTYSGWRSGYGYMVMIDHGDGKVTKYAHNSALLVQKGERVSAGQVIARVGSTGNSTGNHLHFEVVVNGVNKNPAPYLKLK